MTDSLSDTERQALLATARAALEAALAGETAPALDGAGLVSRCAPAFVTLFSRGALRGCTGALEDDIPLSRLIARLAVSSAFSDPRFPSLSADEYAEIRLEISVLSSPQPARWHEVQVGRHGVLVERGRHRGVLLPQVATEHRLDREQFLSATCRKAGLEPQAFRDPDTSVFVFEAEVFGEA